MKFSTYISILSELLFWMSDTTRATQPVRLNVGGTMFHTSTDTLKKNRFFERVSAARDPFIDRDPTHFRMILNFLRSDAIVLPESPGGVVELQVEADYYGIDALVRACNERIVADRQLSGGERRIACEIRDHLEHISHDLQNIEARIRDSVPQQGARGRW